MLRPRDKISIRDLFGLKMKRLRDLESASMSENDPPTRVEGDVPQLHKVACFAVQGVRIGWPYREVMKPQRQMSLRLLSSLKRSLHCIIESPTGTGKSAAILCSALAWQRDHFSRTGTTAKIIYCSRTHSQVQQMVKSLRKTSYRPRMAVLGSRDKLCVHADMEGKKGAAVNNGCRDR